MVRFHDAVNRQDWNALDQMATSDYRRYVVISTGFRARSWEDFRNGNQAAHRAPPDWKNSPMQVLVDGDRQVLGALQIPPGTEEIVRLYARAVTGNAAIHGVISQVDPVTRDGAVFEMSRAD